MVYFLYGADSLRIKRKRSELTGKVFELSPSAEFFEVNMEDDPDAWIAVRDFTRQQSIFGGAKIAAVAGGGLCAAAGWVKFLKESLQDPSSHLFLFQEKKPLKALSFLLRDPVEVFACDELSGDNLARFVSAEAKKRHFSFSPQALRFFIRSLERLPSERSWVAVNEIEKMSFLGKPSVEVSDVVEISQFQEMDEVWMLAKNILHPTKRFDGVSTLEKLFLEGADPAHIFNSLAIQARGEDLFLLAQYDISIKSGKTDFPEALLSFALRGV